MNTAANASDALPTTRTLLRTTAIAAAIAAVLVVGIIMPAEYGVDPTGVGRVLGLTQMGKLKLELMKEEAELQKSLAVSAGASLQESLTAAPAVNPGMREDSMTVTLIPTQRIEVKLAMTKDQVASYRWVVDSGAVFFDLHGEGPKSAGSPMQRYGQGTLHRAEGDITAAFDGVHGWFWENQTSHDIHITVKAWGQFQELKKM